MKTLIFSVLLTTLLGLNCQAQAEPKFSISWAGGPSISLRKLYQQVSDNDRGELAGDGWAGQVGLNYRLFRNLGIAARVNYNQNKTREEGIAKVALYQYNITNPTIIENKDWASISALIGPSFHFYIGQKIVIEGRLMGGYAVVTGPKFELNGVFAGRDLNIKTTTNDAQNWALGAGGTLRYILSNRVSVVVNSDFIQANMLFKNISNTVTASGLTSNPTTEISQKVGYLNVSAGLQLGF